MWVTAGTAQNLITMAPSVFGGAYKEGLQSGIRDTGKLWNYALATTAVECLLERLLGWDKNPAGGALSGKIISNLSQKVSGVFLKGMITMKKRIIAAISLLLCLCIAFALTGKRDEEPEQTEEAPAEEKSGNRRRRNRGRSRGEKPVAEEMAKPAEEVQAEEVSESEEAPEKAKKPNHRRRHHYRRKPQRPLQPPPSKSL